MTEFDQEQWDSLGRWTTQFNLPDVGRIGGDYDPDDYRMSLFREQVLCPGMNSLLELGSLEAGHTVLYAQKVPTVLTIEARQENQARADYIKQLMGVTNVFSQVADLETLPQLPLVDVVSCIGVLYHMTEPQYLLERIAEATDHLFLWTHLHFEGGECLPDTATETGAFYPEYGLGNRLSGTRDRAWWFTKEALLQELQKAGFTQLDILDERENKERPVITLNCRK